MEHRDQGSELCSGYTRDGERVQRRQPQCRAAHASDGETVLSDRHGLRKCSVRHNERAAPAKSRLYPQGSVVPHARSHKGGKGSSRCLQ